MSTETGKNAVQELLESAPTDYRIMARLGLLKELQAAVAQGDTKKQLEIGRKLATNAKEIQEAQAAQRAVMAAAVERAQNARDGDDRAAKLCEAFALCAETQVEAFDKFGGGETVVRAIDHKHAIVAALDAISAGRRSDLAKLLDSSHAGVRACAGAHLLNANLMRKRVVQLLQKIEADEPGSAGWTAFWALSPNDHGAWLTGEAGANEP